MIVTFGERQVVIDFDSNEWEIIEWIESKGTNRLRKLISILLTERNRNMKREKVTAELKRLDDTLRRVNG